MRNKWQQFSTNNSLEYFTNPDNIPNQKLVEATISWFTTGPGARVFEPSTLLNLLWGQQHYINTHYNNPKNVDAHLTTLPLSPLERHVLYGLIIKWYGGYPVNNMDVKMQAVLKGIEIAFLSFEENTPEKEFCKADMQTARQLRNLETLFNTHYRTGTPLGELEKQIFGNQDTTAPPRFKRFFDLYQYSLDSGLLPRDISLREQGLQSAGLETRFQDWLIENRGWHYADVQGLLIHLTMENFTEFLKTDTTPGHTMTQTRLPVPVDKAKESVLGLSVDSELIFVTYSWESGEHKDRVISLTDHLRKAEGFNAQMDEMIFQDQTATDLNKMMFTNIHKASKVIVVLSRGYKQKAEKDEGGVGIEYNIILKDIEVNPQKYILVSFEPFSADIIPFGFKGRIITTLTSPDGIDELVRKLGGNIKYEFSPVAPQKRVVPPKPISTLMLTGKSSSNQAKVNDDGPWNGQVVREGLTNAIDSNDTQALKILLQQNSFLFYQLVTRKDFQQPIFYGVPLKNIGIADFVWLNDNSDGPEWVLLKVAEPGMAVMEGRIPSQSLSRIIDTLTSWDRYFAMHPDTAREIFGAVSRLRLVVVAGTTGVWNKPAALNWRADNNKNGRVEVRSCNVFKKACDLYLEKPDHFWGPKNYPMALAADQLKSYWNTDDYMQQMITLFSR